MAWSHSTLFTHRGFAIASCRERDRQDPGRGRRHPAVWLCVYYSRWRYSWLSISLLRLAFRLPTISGTDGLDAARTQNTSEKQCKPS